MLKNIFLAIIVIVLYSTQTYAVVKPEDLVEHRYTTKVVRNADGTIARSTTVINAFRKVHPCPSTGLTTGACSAGWQINHIIPLACGGRDAVDNMGWFPIEIKTCTTWWCIDRWERKVYALTSPIPDTANCINKIVP